MPNKIQIWELKQKQSLPLKAKIILAKQRIEQFYAKMNGNVCVSFSGGKDSTVLLHLVRSIYPSVKAVFVNTGLEWPEVVQFVREIENCEVIRPTMTFKEVLDTYGYPVTSKKVAKMINTLQNPTKGNQVIRNLYLTGIRGDGKKATGSWKVPEKWRFLIKAPFKISDECCGVMKKKPLKIKLEFTIPDKSPHRETIVKKFTELMEALNEDKGEKVCNVPNVEMKK